MFKKNIFVNDFVTYYNLLKLLKVSSTLTHQNHNHVDCSMLEESEVVILGTQIIHHYA